MGFGKGKSTENIGFMTWGSSYLSLTPGSQMEGRLKVASIFYDKLIFPVDSEHMSGILDTFTEGGKVVRGLGRAWAPFDTVIPAVDVTFFKARLLGVDHDGYSRSGGIVPGLKGAVDEALMESWGVSRRRLRQIASDDRIGYFRECNAILASATGGARAWAQLQGFTNCSLVSFLRVEQVAVDKLVSVSRVDRMEGLYRPVEVFVPSVRGLPWEAIVQLRRHRGVKTFRRWLAGLQKPASITPNADQAIESLWNAFGELKVSTGVEVIKGIIGNIPLPIPINPASVALSAHSITRSAKFNKRNGWLTFLHAAHRASSNSRSQVPSR
jgi:hypothetical protein